MLLDADTRQEPLHQQTLWQSVDLIHVAARVTPTLAATWMSLWHSKDSRPYTITGPPPNWSCWREDVAGNRTFSTASPSSHLSSIQLNCEANRLPVAKKSPLWVCFYRFSQKPLSSRSLDSVPSWTKKQRPVLLHEGSNPAGSAGLASRLLTLVTAQINIPSCRSRVTWETSVGCRYDLMLASGVGCGKTQNQPERMRT